MKKLRENYKGYKGRKRGISMGGEVLETYADKYAKTLLKKKSVEQAKKMVEHGDSDEYISDITGLSIREIREIYTENYVRDEVRKMVVNIAKKMLEHRDSEDYISDITGLTLDEIREIRENIKEEDEK